MKAKIFMCCILTVLVMISYGGICAFAEASPSAPVAVQRSYARADARDVYFCESKDLSTARFTIPYTYCVQILSTDGEWYYVKYAEDAGLYRALYGYCRAENLTPVETPPVNYFLNMPVTVTYKTESNGGSSLPVLGELNVTAAFYGTYYSGASAYSYVLYDNDFGYIFGANDDYPLNEIPVPDPPEEQTTNTKSGGANAKVITAVALAALAVAALIILYLTGRKRYVRPDR